MTKVILFSDIQALNSSQIDATVQQYFHKKFTDKIRSVRYAGNEGAFFAEKTDNQVTTTELEKLRKQGASIANAANENKEVSLEIINLDVNPELAAALTEGVLLANYKFAHHRKDASDIQPTLSNINLVGAGADLMEELKIISQSVHIARNLVNEPVNKLNATELSERFVELGKSAGFSVEVWNEAKIESQKMGGLLAVNAGSQEPPTFTIMEHKPAESKNDKPIILVGKGVVFDTGGLSLKPTPNSMDTMKCDMAGSAAVAATMHAVSMLKLPLWVIALVPATDNRPGENATCPGDIITMYDGTTVEVLNTDAEGRLILADALAFAKKYNPSLVMDFATLTGAAMRALGAYGSALMGTADDEIKNKVKAAGEKVYERLAELPLWEEYFEDTKGDISDLKNLGKGEGGAQSAAMFLKYFTDYPWLHFDIAGTAFNAGNDAYRTKGGTGVGVRLMVEFLKSMANEK